MRLRILVAVVAACLATTTAALAGSSSTILTGTFQTKITGKSAALNATWRIHINDFGKSSTTRNGKLAVTGAIAAAAGTWAITDTGGAYACKGIQVSAAYTYTLKGNQLTLKPKVELCQGRKTILTTHPLTKIS